MAYLTRSDAHPDLRPMILGMANDERKPQWNVTLDDVIVRRQQTFSGCLFERTGELRSESVALATIRASRQLYERLAILWAVQAGATWEMGAYSHGSVGSPQVKPFAAAGIVQGKRLILGLARTVPELASIKATFADGSTAEDHFDGGYGLLFQPLASPGQWADFARVQILDTRGIEFTSDRFDVRPSEVHLATRPGGRSPTR